MASLSALENTRKKGGAMQKPINASQLLFRSLHNDHGDDAKAPAAYHGGTGMLSTIAAYGAGWLICEPAFTQASVQQILGSSSKE
jgi:hypothetical protein